MRAAGALAHGGLKIFRQRRWSGLDLPASTRTCSGTVSPPIFWCWGSPASSKNSGIGIPNTEIYTADREYSATSTKSSILGAEKENCANGWIEEITGVVAQSGLSVLACLCAPGRRAGLRL
jgi:hypothetical protein